MPHQTRLSAMEVQILIDAIDAMPPATDDDAADRRKEIKRKLREKLGWFEEIREILSSPGGEVVH